MRQNDTVSNCGLALVCLLILSAIGCRTEIKSPAQSAYYLHDGPVAGIPELTPETIRAFDAYKLERARLQAGGVAEDAAQ